METHTLRPSSRYMGKLVMVMTLIAVLVMVGGLLLSWPIGLDEGPRVARNVVLGFFLADLAWFVIAVCLVRPYFRSLRYEIQDDEVIVHVGIWTKSVKHVPFRTVTNLKTNRDIFDRWFFGTGSLNIQTAGMSGKTGAEESLVGLPNVQEVYEIVSSRLRRYRGAMGPTAAGEEPEPRGDTLEAILTEVRAIRTAVEK
jgi:uncharacterized membrane protein YdbT with pleckstrin-like domain